MSDILRELLAAFEAEARDHIAVIRHALARAGEGRPYDRPDVFRRAHSLKGAARAVDLPAVEEIAHALEGFFARLGEQAGEGLSPAAIEAAGQALDAIEAQSEALSHGLRPDPPAGIASLVAALGAQSDGVAAGMPSATVRADAPAATDAEPKAAAPPGAATPAATNEPERSPAEVLRVPAPLLDALPAALGLLGAELQGLDDGIRRVAGIAAAQRSLRRTAEDLRRAVAPLLDAVREGGGRPVEPRLARLAEARLSDLERTLSETARAAADLARDQRSRVFAVSQAAGRLAAAVERIALVPAETAFGAFGPILRDLARGEGVEVDFAASGLDIAVDRRLLQDLKDPVLHLVRNAVSHGAEPPEARLAAGRPAAVSVRLTVGVEGGRLVVAVEDDGRGPDLGRIEAVAIDRGLLPARAPGEPPPPREVLLAQVFEPGFTTADSVGRLAGRGVGLAVVADAVHRRHGKVVMRIASGGGTRVELAVPLPTTQRPVLVVEADGEAYALPTAGVERLVRLPQAALRSVEGRPAAWIEIGGRDVLVPVLSLSHVLDGSVVAIPSRNEHVQVVLIRRDARLCGLAVDELLEARVMTVESVDGLGGDPALVSGAVLLAGERPAPVLDPAGLVDRWLRLQTSRAVRGLGLAAGRVAADAPQTTILVVDDSITTRTLEKSILEAQGYRVLLAVDGIDALGILRTGDAIIDLVVADVEMPRMDGFALVQAIRTDPRLSALPVVLMTSRAAPEDVRRGLDLGASAYVTKQKFDQRDLLATIGQLL